MLKPDDKVDLCAYYNEKNDFVMELSWQDGSGFQVSLRPPVTNRAIKSALWAMYEYMKREVT